MVFVVLHRRGRRSARRPRPPCATAPRAQRAMTSPGVRNVVCSRRRRAPTRGAVGTRTGVVRVLARHGRIRVAVEILTNSRRPPSPSTFFSLAHLPGDEVLDLGVVHVEHHHLAARRVVPPDLDGAGALVEHFEERHQPRRRAAARSFSCARGAARVGAGAGAELEHPRLVLRQLEDRHQVVVDRPGSPRGPEVRVTGVYVAPHSPACSGSVDERPDVDLSELAKNERGCSSFAPAPAPTSRAPRAHGESSRAAARRRELIVVPRSARQGRRRHQVGRHHAPPREDGGARHGPPRSRTSSLEVREEKKVAASGRRYSSDFNGDA